MSTVVAPPISSIVYLVTTPKSQMVKVGVWTGDTQALYFRYMAVYGNTF